MKIQQIENIKLSQTRKQQNLREKQTMPKAMTKAESSLPSFDSRGMSIAFKAVTTAATTVANARLVKGANLEKLMTEISVTKAKLEQLLSKKVGEKTDEILKAEETIRKYEYWRDNASRLYVEAVEAAERAKKEEKDKHSGWANFWNDYPEKAYNKTMQSRYHDVKDKYDVCYSDYTVAKNKVETFNKMKTISEEARQNEIALLRKTLEAQEKNINLVSIRDAVNDAMNNEGSLEDRIAGYDGTKREIKRTFVTPLIENVKAGNNNLRIPPAVMLYGATGCGKTSMLNAIRHQVKGYARVVDISGADEKDFIKKLNDHLMIAKKHYLQTKKDNGRGERTILLLNEAEIFLATNPEDMGTSGMFFDKSDIRKMEQYNRDQNCNNIVTEFKSCLDYISKLPTAEEPEGCAATIFITSNYPHLIHRDLLSRDGEFGKMLTIPVRPASNNDLKEVMKYYFTKLSNLIEQIKYFAKQENPDSLMDSIAILSDKGKDVLKQKVKDGTIENLSIDPTLSGFKNIDQFIKGNNPSIRRGAYSNARIENIAKKAFVNYMDNPAVPYEKHFLEEKNKRGVDISPAAYRQFENICDMVENPEKFRQSQSKEIGADLRELVEKYNNGELDDVELGGLKLAVKDIKEKYAELKNSKKLSSTEEKIKKQYEEFLDSIEDIDFS